MTKLVVGRIFQGVWQYIQVPTDSTIPTNTVHVPITTGTVTNSSSECTGFIGGISRYIYKEG